jgi:flagellar motility protein MotE (MotC chaperone)
MRARHDREVADFEHHWSDRSTLLAFNKPSPQLIQIRKQQRQCALAEHFSHAKDLKRRGDDLERIETAEAEKKASASMNLAFRNLTRRQRQEEEHAQMNWTRQLRKLEADRDAEVGKVELCARQLEIKQNDLRGGKIRFVRSMAPIPRVRKRGGELENVAQQEKLAMMGFAVGEREMEIRRKRVSARRPEC